MVTLFFLQSLYPFLSLVRLIVEVTEEREEHHRMEEEECGNNLWVAAVYEQRLRRMNEHQCELELKQGQNRNYMSL